MAKKPRITEWWIRKHAGSKFFSVRFRKKNGEMREMVCRLGVTKDVTGTGMSYDPSDYRLLCVRDVQKKAYRMVNLDTLEWIKIRGVKYTSAV